MIFEFIVKVIIACVLIPAVAAKGWPILLACTIVTTLVGALIASMAAASVLIGALIGVAVGGLLSLLICIGTVFSEL